MKIEVMFFKRCCLFILLINLLFLLKIFHDEKIIFYMITRFLFFVKLSLNYLLLFNSIREFFLTIQILLTFYPFKLKKEIIELFLYSLAYIYFDSFICSYNFIFNIIFVCN